MSKNIINVDNSTLVPVAECTTSAALKALGYGGQGNRDAMNAGSVIHDGLEAHYSNKGREKAIQAFNDSYDNYFPADVFNVLRIPAGYGVVHVENQPGYAFFHQSGVVDFFYMGYVEIRYSKVIFFHWFARSVF